MIIAANATPSQIEVNCTGLPTWTTSPKNPQRPEDLDHRRPQRSARRLLDRPLSLTPGCPQHGEQRRQQDDRHDKKAETHLARTGEHGREPEPKQRPAPLHTGEESACLAELV